MFTRILVPLDGSLRAEKALPLAAKLARAVKGSIVLVRVITAGTEYWPAPSASSDIVGGIIEDERQAAWHYLMKKASGAALTNIPVEIDVRWGPVITSIMDAITSHQCNLMMMCHKKRDGSAHPLTRNVTEQLVLHSSVPVFLLHEEGPQPLFHHLDPLQPQRILVGWDGSCEPLPIFNAAVSLLVDEKGPLQGSIHVAGVFSPEMDDSGCNQEREAIQLMIKEELYIPDDRQNTGGKPSAGQAMEVDLNWSITRTPDPVRTLIDLAEGKEPIQGSGTTGRFDVIVVSSSLGDQECPEWCFGSVINQIMQETHIPILSVPTVRKEPEERFPHKAQTSLPTL
ncbi:hypothetical protein KDA_56500 [Dictyobacter alpinus]|uniref:UspA domain-containing protein n=1 Tax=Dictyobacter alpinus TaxID=2014873 RepID=A0A402BFP7_9CHLR|nr:universal stress protein [Dictyobacter alpinus]GCE30166.1 hypothetical protein KDA_56500 [Dictyobacter alpinus]